MLREKSKLCVAVGEYGSYGDILYKVQRIVYKEKTSYAVNLTCSRCIFNTASCNPNTAPIPCAAHTREDGESVKFLRAEHK